LNQGGECSQLDGYVGAEFVVVVVVVVVGKSIDEGRESVQ